MLVASVYRLYAVPPEPADETTDGSERAMVGDDQIARSKAIQQQTGKTFHVATRLLPPRIREATYVLYAFFRVADEVVDDPGDNTPAQQRAELETIRAAALGETETDDPVLAAFAELREEYDIDPDDVDTFIDAMASDIDTDRYETYAELEAYMDGSASAVADDDRGYGSRQPATGTYPRDRTRRSVPTHELPSGCSGGYRGTRPDLPAAVDA